MTRGSLVWTTDGDSHSVEHGPWKAVIRTSPATDDGLVTIRIRITVRDTVDDETTPVFLHVPAAAAAQRIETLKSELEEDLLRRHRPEEPEAEETTDRLEMGTPAPSPGVGHVRASEPSVEPGGLRGPRHTFRWYRPRRCVCAPSPTGS
jgi:hypothetical protein